MMTLIVDVDKEGIWKKETNIEAALNILKRKDINVSIQETPAPETENGSTQPANNN